jgi:hypothetical protein
LIFTLSFVIIIKVLIVRIVIPGQNYNNHLFFTILVENKSEYGS